MLTNLLLALLLALAGADARHAPERARGGVRGAARPHHQQRAALLAKTATTLRSSLFEAPTREPRARRAETDISDTEAADCVGAVVAGACTACM